MAILALSMAVAGNHIGQKDATAAVCQQAYTAKVHEQIPLCKEWKERIDIELNDKLGVK